MHRHLQSCLDEVIAALDGASDEDVRNTSSGKWNAIEILEHLNLAYVFTGRAIRGRAIRQNAKASTPAKPDKKLPPKIRVARILVLGIGKIPAGREVPKMSVGHSHEARRDLAATRAKFRQHLHDLDEAISLATQRLGPSTPAAIHPILGPFSARQRIRFHLVHTRHHLKQIRERLAAKSSEILPQPRRYSLSFIPLTKNRWSPVRG